MRKHLKLAILTLQALIFVDSSSVVASTKTKKPKITLNLFKFKKNKSNDKDGKALPPVKQERKNENDNTNNNEINSNREKDVREDDDERDPGSITVYLDELEDWGQGEVSQGNAVNTETNQNQLQKVQNYNQYQYTNNNMIQHYPPSQQQNPNIPNYNQYQYQYNPTGVNITTTTQQSNNIQNKSVPSSTGNQYMYPQSGQQGFLNFPVQNQPQKLTPTTAPYSSPPPLGGTRYQSLPPLSQKSQSNVSNTTSGTNFTAFQNVGIQDQNGIKTEKLEQRRHTVENGKLNTDLIDLNTPVEDRLGTCEAVAEKYLGYFGRLNNGLNDNKGIYSDLINYIYQLIKSCSKQYRYGREQVNGANRVTNRQVIETIRKIMEKGAYISEGEETISNTALKDLDPNLDSELRLYLIIYLILNIGTEEQLNTLLNRNIDLITIEQCKKIVTEYLEKEENKDKQLKNPIYADICKTIIKLKKETLDNETAEYILDLAKKTGCITEDNRVDIDKLNVASKKTKADLMYAVCLALMNVNVNEGQGNRHNTVIRTMRDAGYIIGNNDPVFTEWNSLDVDRELKLISVLETAFGSVGQPEEATKLKMQTECTQCQLSVTGGNDVKEARRTLEKIIHGYKSENHQLTRAWWLWYLLLNDAVIKREYLTALEIAVDAEYLQNGPNYTLNKISWLKLNNLQKSQLCYQLLFAYKNFMKDKYSYLDAERMAQELGFLDEYGNPKEELVKLDKNSREGEKTHRLLLYLQQESFNDLCSKLGKAEEQMKKDKLLVRLNNRPMMVIGDLHGDIISLEACLTKFREFLGQLKYENDRRNAALVFLGDYVDRGPHSVEILRLLAELKSRFPNNIYLLRGNHEDNGEPWVSHRYGLNREIEENYPYSDELRAENRERRPEIVGPITGRENYTVKENVVLTRLRQFFDHMSVVAVNNNLVLMHGYIPYVEEWLEDPYYVNGNGVFQPAVMKKGTIGKTYMNSMLNHIERLRFPLLIPYYTNKTFYSLIDNKDKNRVGKNEDPTNEYTKNEYDIDQYKLMKQILWNDPLQSDRSNIADGRSDYAKLIPSVILKGTPDYTDRISASSSSSSTDLPADKDNYTIIRAHEVKKYDEYLASHNTYNIFSSYFQWSWWGANNEIEDKHVASVLKYYKKKSEKEDEELKVEAYKIGKTDIQKAIGTLPKHFHQGTGFLKRIQKERFEYQSTEGNGMKLYQNPDNKQNNKYDDWVAEIETKAKENVKFSKDWIEELNEAWRP